MNRLLKLILPLCVVFTACSSDDDKPALPVFPELQVVTVDAGQETEIQFDAPDEWRLVSDKAWVRFINSDSKEEVAVVYGPAGRQTVTIVTKTDGHTFMPETAALNMTMVKSTRKVFEVTRRAKSREITMMVREGYSGPFVSADRLDMSPTGSYRLGFTANFDWKVVSSPEWIEPLNNITGKAGTEVTVSTSEGVYIKAAETPYEKSGEIVIAPRLGDGDPVTFPVTYAGKDGKELNIDPPLYKNNGVMFSLDGFYCIGSGADYDPYVPTTNKSITFKVITRNMERRMVLIEYDIAKNAPKEIPLAGSWISCVESADSRGEMTLSLLSDNESTETRSLYLYFLPPHYFDNSYNFANDFTVTNGKVTFKGRTALGMAVSQQGKAKTEGFTLYDDMGIEMLPSPVKVTDPYITEMYEVTNIYERKFTKDEWDSFSLIWIEAHGNPNLEEVIWDFDDEGVWGEAACEDGKAAIYGRRPYDQLPSRPGYLFFMDGWDIQSVLRISKAE